MTNPTAEIVDAMTDRFIRFRVRPAAIRYVSPRAFSVDIGQDGVAPIVLPSQYCARTESGGFVTVSIPGWLWCKRGYTLRETRPNAASKGQ